MSRELTKAVNFAATWWTFTWRKGVGSRPRCLTLTWSRACTPSASWIQERKVFILSFLLLFLLLLFIFALLFHTGRYLKDIIIEPFTSENLREINIKATVNKPKPRGAQKSKKRVNEPNIKFYIW